MRVTENLMFMNFLSRTARSLSTMAAAQERISTGKRILRPSDDPLGLAKAMSIRTDLRNTAAYADNASSATAFMSLTESSLQEVSDLLSRAKETMVEAANATSEGVGGAALVLELRSMIDELMILANREVGGRSLFGGHDTLSRPYSSVGDRVLYSGDGGDIVEELSAGLRVAINLTGPDALQTIPSRILGSEDLDPAVSRITPLADLFGGSGVLTGQIRITDSNGVAADLDLLGATSVGDVVDAVNNAGTAIVATIAADGSGIELTDTGGGASFGVEDLLGGTFARDLGLAGTSDTGSMRSVDLDPVVGENTPLSLLFRGAGPGAGSLILRNNAEGETDSVRIDPSEANTVGELLDLLSSASTTDGRSIGVRASIVDGALSIESTRLHTTLSISDATGGDYAARLGIRGSGEADDVFGLLGEAARAIESGDQDLMERMIGSFTEAIERTASVRGTYGARSRQVLAMASRLADQEVDLSIRLSDLEDADLAEAVMQLTQAETVYNASLSTGTRLLGQNLFNFIR